MNILYVSNYVDSDFFQKIFEMAEEKPIQSIQKFNSLLLKGLISSDDVVNINVLSSAPVNRQISKKVFWKGKNKTIDDINYTYIPFINLKIIKQICLFFFSIFFVFAWFIKNINKEKVLIFDGFYPIVSTVAVLILKLFKVKIVALYTDIPKCINHNMKKETFFYKIVRFVVNLGDYINLKFTDKFILLTQQMNEVLNKKNKPYLVMEGLVDFSFKQDKNINKKKSIMYAGGLYEKYGIKMLIDAFLKWNNSDFQLWLCGSGDLVNYINENKKKNIKYFGSLPNEDIIKLEQEASLLINPRFTNEEYTKYSFPSKNMEYMLSGTPLLTTKLPGMPKEYYDYVYTIDEETEDGIISELDNIFSKSSHELKEFGEKACKFVFENKNNLIQANRIVELIYVKNKTNKKNTSIEKKIIKFYLLINVILIVLSFFNPFGLYNVSKKTYFIYISSVLFTIIGVEFLSYLFKKNKEKSNEETKEKKVNIKIDWIAVLNSKYFFSGLLISLGFVLYYFVKYFILISNADPSEFRMIAFTKLYGNAFSAIFYLYVVSNIGNLSPIVLSLILFDKSLEHHKKKRNIILLFLIFLLYSLIGLGRFNYLRLLISIIFIFIYFIDSKREFLKRNLKMICKIFTFVIILSMFSIFIRVFKDNFEVQQIFTVLEYQIKQIFEYFLGSFRTFDIFINNGFQELGEFSFGRATFAGVDEIILYPIKFFNDNVFSFNQLISPITQKGIPIGSNTPYYNAFYTSVMNFYLDFKFVGVISFSLMHGFFIMYVVKLQNKLNNLISKTLLLFVTFNLLMCSLKWEYQSGNTIFLLIVLITICNLENIINFFKRGEKK